MRPWKHKLVPCVHQQCAVYEAFDVDWTTLAQDRLVRTKSLPPIPQLDRSVATGPLEVQRKLDPSDRSPCLKAPQRVCHECYATASDINLCPRGSRREFQPLVR